MNISKLCIPLHKALRFYCVEVRVNWISKKQQPHTKRTDFEYLWKSHVTKSYIKEFDDLREHLPVSGGPRSIFLGPLEIDRSHGRRMMRLDGTRRETGATDYRVEERAHLGRLSLSLLSQHLQPSLSALCLCIGLSSLPLVHTSPMSISFSPSLG